MRFEELCNYLLELEKTSKRLEMIDILSKVFSRTKTEEINYTVNFIQEQILPPFYNVQLGIADKMVEKSIALAYNKSVSKIFEEYKRLGDLGEIAEKESNSSQTSKTDITEVYGKLLKIAKTSGEGSIDEKIKGLSDLILGVSPIEAKFIIRFVMGKLRLGVGEATIMEALSKAKTGNRKFKSNIERAFNLCSDLGYVAEVLYSKGEEGINKFEINVMKPIRPALAERLGSSKEILERLGKCAIDQKLDGFRAQVHKKGSEVRVFSRNLEDITHFMPEIVNEVKKIDCQDLIIDGEALTYDENTNVLYPFQITIQRKRKHNVEKISQELPLRLFVFDVILFNKKSMINEPYIKRRELLDKLFSNTKTISKTKMIITDDEKEIDRFFDSTIEEGLEGIVAKRLDSPYSAGARNFNWIKMKRSYKSKLNDTIDLVILGYFKGRGQRAGFGLGAVLAGVYDSKEDKFKSITKVGSGFSEEQFKQLFKILNEIKTDGKPARVDSIMQPDVWVVPKYVIAVKADEITRSPTHTAGMKDGIGYALRFPRAVSFIRTDKKAEDANTVKDVIEMYGQQKNISIKN
ncbi:MAG: ATP-dependent DNA ligase [Candidatus Parvarchaeota archaeon]|jgi:DNA ligase-1|nr:ATP-dependent DNA ligase [Candidatus Parvarchaeota archaeon]MCL5107215.1 ATP-dependent DNA ligase [Candidatus Parvarchaeota archaeon]